MGVCIDQEVDELLMVTELMENGSVFDILHKKKLKLPFKQRMKIGTLALLSLSLVTPAALVCSVPMADTHTHTHAHTFHHQSGCSRRLACKIAKDCALGLNYLHLNKPNPILHLDLKTANLLVDANFVTKVAGTCVVMKRRCVVHLGQ